MRKKILVFSLMFLMLCPFAVTAVEYKGSSGGNGMGHFESGQSVWVSGIGSWGSVRLTAVDKDGKRLILNVNGKPYKSRTLDYFGYGLRNDDWEHLSVIRNGNGHYISCGSVQQGDSMVPTLCSKRDYYDFRDASTGGAKSYIYQIAHGGKDRHFERINNYSQTEKDWATIFDGGSYTPNWNLPTGYDGHNNGNSLENVFRQFQNIQFDNSADAYKIKIFERIFEDLMGISISDIQNASGASCDTNKKALEEAFVIIEPVSKMTGVINGIGTSNFVGSATEIGIFSAQRDSVEFPGFLKQVNSNLFNAIRCSDKPADNDLNFPGFYFTNINTDIFNGWLERNELNSILTFNKGAYGLGALHFKDTSPAAQKINCYNYSIDAACTDCESKNGDNRAYVIQDTTNWEAIKNSRNYNSSNNDIATCVKGHFYREPGVFCREEYHVFLPNQNNKIVVQTGKYFTLNRGNTSSNESTMVIPNDVPDFKPIKVEKIRQCTGDKNNLDAFEKNSNSEFKGTDSCGAGTVEVSYSEGIADGYKLEKEILKADKTTYSGVIVNDVLTQKLVSYYTLNTNTFRYIRKKDGKSVSKKEDGEFYVDLGIGNLPISFRNNKANVKVGFAYKLPTCDSYSNMSAAFDGSCKLSNGDSEANVYKNYKEGVKIPGENIEESACVKLYGAEYLNEPSKGTENYNYALEQHTKLMACINSRKDKKSGNCVNSLSVSTTVDDKEKAKNNKDDKEKTEKSDYSYVCFEPVVGKPHICETKKENDNIIYYDDSGKIVDASEYAKKCCNTTENADNCCVTPEKAKELGRSWNSHDNVCCPYGQTYDPIKETCVSKNPECTQDTEGRSWNSAKGECCPEGEKYNENTKKCEVPCKDLKCDTNSNGDPACCKDSSGNESCGYFKNGRLICPGKPSFDDLIYRPIDLNQPFIAQNGASRDTGENWCAYENGVLNCESENNVVKTIITENNVSEENAMYKVTLDPDTIREIRNYNKEAKTYNDWDLDCKSNGKACVSKFLHNSNISKKISGKCSNADGKDNFYSCSEGGD